MSFFTVVEAEGTINKTLNPSAEAAGNYAAAPGGGIVTRVTTSSLYGIRSYRVQTAANDEGIDLTLDTLANAIHYVTVRVRGTLPASWDWSLNGANYTSPVLLLDLDGDWAVYGVQFPAVQANLSTSLYIEQNGAGAGDFNLDGIQVEEKSDYTTYCDGDQDGCEWSGGEHASTSTRSEISRAGGTVLDLVDNLGFELISQFMGSGMHSVRQNLQNYALLPGALWQSAKDEVRQFSILGPLRGSDASDFHAKRERLIKLFTRDVLGQPALLRYSGATTIKEITVRYSGGLELTQMDGRCETVNLRLLSEQPYWQQIGESAVLLDEEDTLATRQVTARLNGAWDNVGAPNPSGTVYAIKIASDKLVYIGGTFAGWNGVGGADNVTFYNVQTGVYDNMTTGTDALVRVIEEGPDGTIYVGGDYTSAGGVANTSRIASWDGAAWSALGTGAANNEVYSIAIGPDGNVYVGGSYTQMGGVANTQGIAYWDGAAWNAMVSGVTGGLADVYAVAVDTDGNVYIGGSFTAVGGVSANYVARWDGSAWNAMGTGMNNTVTALAIADDGTVFAGGTFTTAGGETVNYIAQWNGQAWSSLGSGMDAAVRALRVAPDGILYAIGVFTEAGGITLANSMARWNGYTWAHLDIRIPGGPSMLGLDVGNQDPVVDSNYDVWIGHDTAGNIQVAGSVTATVAGTARAFPAVTFERIPGGTSAVLATLRNETTGKEILMDYDLQDGEVLTLDLRPGQQAVSSSFFGSRPDAVLENSDFSDFVLESLLNGGVNTITAFFIRTGSTMESAMRWRESFKSIDD